jgi:hypothetical protein
MSSPVKEEDVIEFKTRMRQRIEKKITFHVRPELLATIRVRAKKLNDDNMSRVVKRMFNAGEGEFFDKFMADDEDSKR